MEWKKLRDNHRDALKRAKLGKNKLLPAQITTWKYAKAMQFLEPHMKYRITENIESVEPYSYPIQEKIEPDVSTTEVAPQCSVNKPAVKRKLVDQSSGTDALDSFFSCMLQSTREMPHWMQTQVKRKIFNVIIEAEEAVASQRQDSYEQFGLNDGDNQAAHGFVIKTEIMNDDD